MKFPDTKKVFSIKTKEEKFHVAKFLNGDENHKLIIYGIWTLNQLAPKLRPIFPLHKRNFVHWVYFGNMLRNRATSKTLKQLQVERLLEF